MYNFSLAVKIKQLIYNFAVLIAYFKYLPYPKLYMSLALINISVTTF